MNCCLHRLRRSRKPGYFSKINALLPCTEGHSISTKGKQGLINLKYRTACPKEFLQQLQSMEHITDVKQLEPILAVPSNRQANIPFESAEEMLQLAEKENKELWELAIEYEMARSGWSYEQVYSYMESVIKQWSTVPQKL